MNEPDPDLIRETLKELEAEAQITPTVLEFPDEVIEAIEVYEKAYSVHRDLLIGLAIKAHMGRSNHVSEACTRLIADPEAFAWPIIDHAEKTQLKAYVESRMGPAIKLEDHLKSLESPQTD
jgi:hypothetical protein